MITDRIIERKIVEREWITTGHKIFVTGHTGLVGAGIVNAINGKDKVIGFSRGNTLDPNQGRRNLQIINGDLSNFNDLLDAIRDTHPSLILHLVFDINVDSFEGDKSISREEIEMQILGITTVANMLDIPVIAASSDYRYGKMGGPFSEGDARSPINKYGEAKTWMEDIIFECLPFEQRMLAVFSSPYDFDNQTKPGTPPLLLNLMRQNKALKVVGDARTTYTNVDDIAYALNRLILNKVWQERDIVHIAGPDVLSARDIIEINKEFVLGYSGEITEVTLDEYFKGRAERPREGGLKTETLNGMKVKMRSYREVLGARAPLHF